MYCMSSISLGSVIYHVFHEHAVWMCPGQNNPGFLGLTHVEDFKDVGIAYDW